MSRSYAGIGSRQTPDEIGKYMTSLAERLRGVLTLRSGGADGADSFFEAGAGEDKEIYLPWRDFNGNHSPLYGVCSRAESLARKYHPAPHRLNGGTLKLMARNSYQVLGRNLDDPVEFVICWTPEGSGSGGTGQAIRIAKDYQIPVFDLGSPETRLRLEEFLAIRVWR